MFVALSFAASKPIESVVFCFYKITVSKTENVSVFYEFTGTINCRFFNQSERAYYLSVVFCFYKITVSKTENVSVFYEFTGTINCRFFNQSERAYYLIYFIKIHKLAQG